MSKDTTGRDKPVLAAAKRFVTAYLKYGKELDTEIDALAKAAMKRWPELREIDS